MRGSLPPLQPTRDHIGDMVRWIEAGHYVRLYKENAAGDAFQSCFHLCQGGNHAEVQSYLAQHWVISIDLTFLPELFDLSLLEIPRLVQQGTCTCNLKGRISALENIPHLENFSLPCTREQGRRIWGIIVNGLRAFLGGQGPRH